jgi:Na+-transporting NADH:ubiquinone oxidoreductase subunit B
MRFEISQWNDVAALFRRLSGIWRLEGEVDAEGRYLATAGLGALLCLGYASAVQDVRILAVAATAALAGVLVEWIFSEIRRKPITGGAFIHGLLLSLLLPATLPLWMAALGGAFGAIFGKEVFGGPRHCLFNPVLVAKAFILYSYPVASSGVCFGNLVGVDGKVWQGAAVLLLICAAMQLLQRPSNGWIYLGIGAAAYGVASYVVPVEALPFDGDLRQLFNANGWMVIACLLSVDPAGAPERGWAKLIFGLIAGALSILMRCYSMYVDAFLSALLIANIFAPTLDMLFRAKCESKEEP